MTIEFIGSRNSFFEDVKALGRKNSATLGFMPEGGFEDHARNKCIIIAHDGKTLAGYLMFRVVSRFSGNLRDKCGNLRDKCGNLRRCKCGNLRRCKCGNLRVKCGNPYKEKIVT